MIECWFKEQQIEQPEPNGDVGGPLLAGVIVTTAWLTVGATALYYLFALRPKQTPSHGDNDDGEDNSPTNCIDSAISQFGAYLSKHYTIVRWFFPEDRPGWGQPFAKSILTMCDIQTLVGLSLLISGFLSLSGGISAYHFMLVVQTAWFAHVAQTNALSILRHTKNNNPVMKWARILLTVVLTGLLIGAIVPTFFFNWAYSASAYTLDTTNHLIVLGGSASLPGSDAVCFFDIIRSVKWHYESNRLAWKFEDTPAFASGVAAIVFVSLNSIVRIFRVNGWLDSPVTRARRGISKGWKWLFADAAESESVVQKIAAHIGLATLLTARLHSDLLTSALSGVYWLIVPAIWGTITLTRARSSSQVADGNWTFGQIFPIVIILGVLIMTVTSLLSSKIPTPLPIIEPTSGSPKSALPRQHYTDASTSTNDSAHPSTLATQAQITGAPQVTLPLFERDYSSAAFLSPAIFLLCIHTFLFTTFFFRNLYDRQPNALSLLVFYLVPCLVGIPSSTFLFVLSSITYEKVISNGKSKVGAYWKIMVALWVATGGWYSILLLGRTYMALCVANFIVLSVGAVIGVGIVIALMVARKSGRMGAISL